MIVEELSERVSASHLPAHFNVNNCFAGRFSLANVTCAIGGLCVGPEQALIQRSGSSLLLRLDLAAACNLHVLCVKLFQGLGQQLADADGLVALALS